MRLYIFLGYRMKRLFYAVLLLVTMTGCGYTLVGQGNLPEHIKMIAIPVFENTTLEEGIEQEITSAVVQEFVRGGKVKLVSEDKADAVLTGKITAYKTEGVQYQNVDDKTEVTTYKLTVTVVVELKDLVNDTVLWKNDGLSEDEDYEGGPLIGASEEKDNESNALSTISKDLAGKIRTLSTEGF